MARESEFLALDDAALRAVVGPHSRHIALIEDAFKVLVEAPGGVVQRQELTFTRHQAAFCWSRPVREFCCPRSIVTGTICPMR